MVEIEPNCRPKETGDSKGGVSGTNSRRGYRGTERAYPIKNIANTEEEAPSAGICSYCGHALPNGNKRKKYCSPKCNKNAYMARRYERDGKFNERMRGCWQKYGMNACPKCGRMKRKKEENCRYCDKLDAKLDTINLESMTEDSESLFSDPESLMRMEVMMTLTSNPTMGADELFEAFKEQDCNIDHKVLRKIIEEVIENLKH